MAHIPMLNFLVTCGSLILDWKKGWFLILDVECVFLNIFVVSVSLFWRFYILSWPWSYFHVRVMTKMRTVKNKLSNWIQNFIWDKKLKERNLTHEYYIWGCLTSIFVTFCLVPFGLFWAKGSFTYYIITKGEGGFGMITLM